MAVMVPRETVTEHRLDALEKKVDGGFEQMGTRFDHLEKRLERMEDRFDAQNRTLLAGFAVITATLIGGTFF